MMCLGKESCGGLHSSLAPWVLVHKIWQPDQHWTGAGLDWTGAGLDWSWTGAGAELELDETEVGLDWRRIWLAQNLTEAGLDWSRT